MGLEELALWYTLFGLMVLIVAGVAIWQLVAIRQAEKEALAKRFDEIRKKHGSK